MYEIQRTSPFVENVAKLSNLYSSRREEVMSIAMRNDEGALGKFLVNNPRLEYFPKTDGKNSLVHFIAQAGSVKMMKLTLCAVPAELSLARVVNLVGNYSNPPIQFAVSANRLAMVKV